VSPHNAFAAWRPRVDHPGPFPFLTKVVTSPNQRIVDGRCLFRSSVFSFAVPGHNSNLKRVEGSVFPGPLLVGRCDQPRRIALKLKNGSSFNAGPVHNPPHRCVPLPAIVGESCRQRVVVQRVRDCFPILTRLAWQSCRFPAGIPREGLAQRGRPPFPMGKHWPCFNRDGHIRCLFSEFDLFDT
jgi:hypothetical protein